jgi:hypothetical protein
MIIIISRDRRPRWSPRRRRVLQSGMILEMGLARQLGAAWKDSLALQN